MKKPAITHDDVAAHFGELTDQQLIDILESGATQNDLAVAAAYIAQEDDAMGEERKPLSGAAAAVYEIVMRDEEHPEEEHAP
jgi:hypothetical protein